jgi:hypothetical protein
VPQLDINNNVAIIGQIIFFFICFYALIDLQFFYKFFVTSVVEKLYKRLFFLLKNEIEKNFSSRIGGEQLNLKNLFINLLQK